MIRRMFAAEGHRHGRKMHGLYMSRWSLHETKDTYSRVCLRTSVYLVSYWRSCIANGVFDMLNAPPLGGSGVLDSCAERHHHYVIE